MTWDDLKSYVDRKLSALGQDGSIEVDYIQISLPNFDRLFDGPVVVTGDEHYDGNPKLRIYNGGLVPPEARKAEVMLKLVMTLMRRLKMLEQRPRPMQARRRFLSQVHRVRTHPGLRVEAGGYVNHSPTLPRREGDFMSSVPRG